MEDFEIELKKTFLLEADQLLTDVEQCFLDLEKNPDDPNMIAKIFRLAHNLKGSANGVGFTDVGEFTHHLESLLLLIKNGEIKINQVISDLLLKSTDCIAKMVATLGKDISATFNNRELIEQLELAIKTKGQPALPKEAPKAGPPGFELFDDNDTFQPELPQKPAAPAAPTIEPQSRPTPQAVAGDTKLTSPETNKSTTTQTIDDGIRVSLARVETLIDFVGEIVILQSVLRDQLADATNPSVRHAVNQMGKVTKEVQDLSMSLRMVPVKPVFQKLQRIVRDTSKALAKDITFRMVGAETEIDKTVLEKISDPLVHLIRNSCDHGIEPTADRVKSGKNSAGLVTLSAYRQSSKLVFEVRDDGAGLNPEKLKRIATEKGLIKPGTQMSDKDAMNLIFAPGFSTKDVVTDISGRGVGMDVVKTNIEQLQGQITIESERGKGTSFKIYLPLTLAIIDAMIIKSLNDRYVMPLSQVHETVRMAGAQIKHSSNLGDILLLRGESIPIFNINDLLGKKSATQIQQDAIAIIVRTMEKPYAVVVDDILGRFQVVTKQLGSEFQGLNGVSGCTILGDGRPALTLEIDELVRSYAKAPNHQPKTHLKMAS